MTHSLRSKTHTTVRATIKALGGTARVAEDVGVSMQAVSNWMREGVIPPGHHMQFYLRVQSRGERIAPSVFGLDSEGRALKSRRAA